MIGKTISHYDILEKLGEGSMGKVYKAEDTKLKRNVALKFLPIAFSRDPDAKKRFMDEARSSSHLDHANICVIHDIRETDDGQLYIVMNYCKGSTLADFIKEKDLSIKEIIKYLTQVAKGLERAHSNGIIHCDIKPTNIIVTEDDVAKIVDFGIAKIASEEKLISNERTSGTIAYMSPEQVSNAKIDARSDIWSLGVVFYEMLTKQLPFQDNYNEALMYSIINEEPESIAAINSDVPPELEKKVFMMLAKNPDKRYQSVSELLSDIKKYQKSISPIQAPLVFKQLIKIIRKPIYAIPATILLILLFITISRVIYSTSKLNWARTKAIPEIERLIEIRERKSAYDLALRAEKYISNDSSLIKLWPSMSYYVSIQSDPIGAKVYRSNSPSDTIWQYIGTTPIDSMRTFIEYSKWKIDKQGFEKLYRLAHPWHIHNEFLKLDTIGNISSAMSRIPGGVFSLSMPGLDHMSVDSLSDFLLDKYEVTNEQYKIFVDNGGYNKKEYWKYPFIKDGKHLSWQEAIPLFIDKTGRAGPATWEAGSYPDGTGNYPVGGVSWYEASAFAEFIGKKIPTIYHWNRASGSDWRTPSIVPFSNINGTSIAPVGTYPGMHSYGSFDMAGNVREWCWNNSNVNDKYILGGGWNDLSYMFSDAYSQPSFDRSATNGFRCMKYFDAEDLNKNIYDVIKQPSRDFISEIPASDEIFNIYKNQFAYDKSDLNSIAEIIDTTSKYWITEKIIFDAAYSDEKVTAFLYLPKDYKPPYQTIVLFPGSDAIIDERSSITRYVRSIDFFLKSGRAVLFPTYKGTYERGDDLVSDLPDESNFYKEHVIMWVKDLNRSVDYLESRIDIDKDNLAFYGISWGAAMGPIMLCVEDRLKTGILYVAGLNFQKSQPEVEVINYLPRIKSPVLILNGRYDHFFPYETSQKPLFELIGTEKKNKKLVLHETGHFVPRAELIKESLNWLDKYLGLVDK